MTKGLDKPNIWKGNPHCLPKMNIYIYIFLYIHVYMTIYTYTHTYMYICTYLSIWVGYRKNKVELFCISSVQSQVGTGRVWLSSKGWGKMWWRPIQTPQGNKFHMNAVLVTYSLFVNFLSISFIHWSLTVRKKARIGQINKIHWSLRNLILDEIRNLFSLPSSVPPTTWEMATDI